MRLIGVVDLLAGRAVHARAGDRTAYAPVRAVDGDARALTAHYLRLGVRELYVADLGAILHARPQPDAIRDLAAAGAPLWLDMAIMDPDAARAARALGAAHVVVGLETLPALDALRAVCDAVGGARVAFSLDLRDGVALAGDGVRERDPSVLAAGAADAGVGAVIVLDLARVGTGAGLDLALLAGVRDAAPGVALLAGGGVRGEGDLRALADAGCDGALVASALLDGRLDAAAVARAHAL